MKIGFLKSEKFFITIIVIAIFLFNSAPYIYQPYNNPPDKTYIGSFPIVTDKPVYLAEMTQGAEGEWLFAYNYTTEPEEKTFIYFFYIFLGHLATILNLPLETAFLLSRFFFGLILIATVILFIRYFVKNEMQRKIAYVLVFFSSGLGFITNNSMSLDRWIPDFIPMVRFSYFPHMVFANILLLVIILLFFHSLKTKSINLAFLSGFLSFILNILLPYHNFVIYSVISLFLLLNFFKNRLFSLTDYFKNGLIFFTVSLPSFIYMAYLGLFDPFWREIAKYNSLPTPPITELLTGFGLILIPSIYGLYFLLKNKNFYGSLFLFWTISAFLIAYIPFIPMQRRVLETGLFVPLAITASFGILTIYNKLKAKNIKLLRLKTCLLLIFIFPYMVFGNVVNLLDYAGVVRRINDPLFYVPNENIKAMRWLRQNSFSDSIILSSYYNGNIIPYYANRMVYVGHTLMTIDSEKKLQEIESFYSGKKSSKEMEQFLKDKKISHVFFSEQEKTDNIEFDLKNYNFLKKIYQKDNVTIYKVLLPKI